MNGRKLMLFAVCLTALALWSLPEQADAHGRSGGFFRGGSNVRFFGGGGCGSYGGGSAIRFSNIGYSRSYSSVGFLGGGCYTAPIYSAPIYQQPIVYAPPVVYQQPIVQQPVVYTPPAQYVAPVQQYTVPQYNTAPSCPCHNQCVPATGGGTVPYNPAGIQTYAAPVATVASSCAVFFRSY